MTLTYNLDLIMVEMLPPCQNLRQRSSCSNAIVQTHKRRHIAQRLHYLDYKLVRKYAS